LVLYKGRNNKEGEYYFEYRVMRSMGKVLGGASIIEDPSLD
jgi:hypothetical protein